MPQDYAFQNEAPEDPRRSKYKQLTKLVLYIVILLTLLFSARYLYLHVDFTQLEEKAISSLPNTSKLTKTTPIKLPKPKFEFYTMLPKGETSKLHIVQAKPPIQKAEVNLPKASIPAPKLKKDTPTPTQTIKLKQPNPQTINKPTHIAKAPVKVSRKPKPQIIARPTQHKALAPKIPKKQLAKKLNPAPKPVLAKSTKGQFLLQVGSFRTFADAHKLKGELLLEGFTVKISTFTNESITWHRVMVGPFHSLAQAQKAQDTLEDANLNCLLKRIG